MSSCILEKLNVVRPCSIRPSAPPHSGLASDAGKRVNASGRTPQAIKSALLRQGVSPVASRASGECLAWRAATNSTSRVAASSRFKYMLTRYLPGSWWPFSKADRSATSPSVESSSRGNHKSDAKTVVGRAVIRLIARRGLTAREPGYLTVTATPVPSPVADCRNPIWF